jgi:hypothetical protein
VKVQKSRYRDEARWLVRIRQFVISSLQVAKCGAHASIDGQSAIRTTNPRHIALVA